MKTELSRWGNSLAVRIPKPVAEAAKLKSGDVLDVDSETAGTVRLCKTPTSPTLQQLVRGITEENRHAVVDWGQPVGNELW